MKIKIVYNDLTENRQYTECGFSHYMMKRIWKISNTTLAMSNKKRYEIVWISKACSFCDAVLHRKSYINFFDWGNSNWSIIVEGRDII